MDGAYVWHRGYWGPHVGFYGGVHYGFGYDGVGFVGGVWRGGVFRYNTAVMRVNTTVIHNTYVDRTVIHNTVLNRASFNGRGGIMSRPTRMEEAAMHEQHFQPTARQAAFRDQATRNARDGFGHRNEVNSRQGNQQQRITQGVRSGADDSGRDAQRGEPRCEHQPRGAERPRRERRAADRAGTAADQPAAEQREPVDLQRQAQREQRSGRGGAQWADSAKRKTGSAAREEQRSTTSAVVEI